MYKDPYGISKDSHSEGKTISKKGVIKYKVNLRLGLFSLASFSQTDKQTYTLRLLCPSRFLYTQTLLTTQ